MTGLLLFYWLSWGRVRPDVRSNNEQISEFTHRHLLQRSLIKTDGEDSLLLFQWEAACKVGLELLDQERHSLLAATAVSDGIFNFNVPGCCAVLEKNLNCIGNGALPGVKIIFVVVRVLNADHFLPQDIDPRIIGNAVLVIGRSEPAEDETDCDHVLYTVIPVRGIVQRSLLVDDTDGGLLGRDINLLDLIELVLHLWMEQQRAFHRGLEFSIMSISCAVIAAMFVPVPRLYFNRLSLAIPNPDKRQANIEMSERMNNSPI